MRRRGIQIKKYIIQKDEKGIPLIKTSEYNTNPLHSQTEEKSVQPNHEKLIISANKKILSASKEFINFDQKLNQLKSDPDYFKKRPDKKYYFINDNIETAYNNQRKKYGEIELDFTVPIIISSLTLFGYYISSGYLDNFLKIFPIIFISFYIWLPLTFFLYALLKLILMIWYKINWKVNYDDKLKNVIAYNQHLHKHIYWKEMQIESLEGLQRKFWIKLSGHNFEKELFKLFRNEGFKVKKTPGSNDGGIDLFLYKGKEVIPIQCKNHKHKVNPNDIRAFCGSFAFSNMKKGILIGSSGFSNEMNKFKNVMEFWTIEHVIALSIRNKSGLKDEIPTILKDSIIYS